MRASITHAGVHRKGGLSYRDKVICHHVSAPTPILNRHRFSVIGHTGNPFWHLWGRLLWMRSCQSPVGPSAPASCRLAAARVPCCAT